MKIKSVFLIAFVKRFKIAFNIIRYLYLMYIYFILIPMRKYINYYLFKKYYLKTSDKLIKESLVFMKRNGVSMIPFNFSLKYNIDFHVNIDSFSGYPYVKVKGNNIFFPKRTSKSQIISAVKTALIEQDLESPHKYIANNIKISGHTAVLIGGSDGIFAIEIANLFNHIFLFECDNEWILPVSQTLKPFEKKFTIVNKFVSDRVKDNQISLDDFFKNYKYPIDFMQNDVEGNALLILRGSKRILKENNITIASACYHTNSEAEELDEFLFNAGYSCSFSDKFVFMWMQKLQKPYLRKAVLYAKKLVNKQYNF